jgi:hypothetical protein
VKRDFIVICTGFLLEKTAPLVAQVIKKYEHSAIKAAEEAGGLGNSGYPIAPNVAQMKEADIQGFRELLS